MGFSWFHNVDVVVVDFRQNRVTQLFNFRDKFYFYGSWKRRFVPNSIPRLHFSCPGLRYAIKRGHSVRAQKSHPRSGEQSYPIDLLRWRSRVSRGVGVVWGCEGDAGTRVVTASCGAACSLACTCPRRNRRDTLATSHRTIMYAVRVHWFQNKSQRLVFYCTYLLNTPCFDGICGKLK